MTHYWKLGASSSYEVFRVKVVACSARTWKLTLIIGRKLVNNQFPVRVVDSGEIIDIDQEY